MADTDLKVGVCRGVKRRDVVVSICQLIPVGLDLVQPLLPGGDEFIVGGEGVFERLGQLVRGGKSPGSFYERVVAGSVPRVGVVARACVVVVGPGLGK